MKESEVAPLQGKPWPTLSHRAARVDLERLGWSLFAQGDWAYAYRSPSGRFAARVSPFEPGYGYFVDLCERCRGNRYVPRIELASELEGGGHLAILEFLDSPRPADVVMFLRQWEHPDEGDDDLRTLRHEVGLIDAWGSEILPGWIGIDIGERHVLLAADGNLKVLDLFGVGWGFLEELLRDPYAFARSMPGGTCEYILDIPDLQLDHPADYLRRIESALEAAKASR